MNRIKRQAAITATHKLCGEELYKDDEEDSIEDESSDSEEGTDLSRK